MMAKGYFDKELKNRMLQMQVYWEVEKIRVLDPPHPPKGSGHGRDGPVDSFGGRTNTTTIVILVMMAGATGNGASPTNCYGSSSPPTNLKGWYRPQ